MTSAMRFSTALRNEARSKIEKLEFADIVIGIPTYQSAASIVHVIKTAIAGLNNYYPQSKTLIFVADGGSTDDTRELARSVDPKSYHIESIVAIYRGVPGKGTALRAVLEASNFLKARAVAVFDSDLKSITPEWLRNVLDPVFKGHDFVAPYYKRYKFDGTITNSIAYNLTRALYGYKIRQPIGGDFGISQSLVKHYLEQDVWETDVAKFGIDIWMTTSAVVGAFNICQARLGAKIHGEKDPSEDLGPMFRQVVGTTFQLMSQYTDYWREVKGSRDISILGEEIGQEAAAFDIDQEALIEYFRVGFRNFGSIWQNILEEDDCRMIKSIVKIDCSDKFQLPVESWVRIVYRYAAAFRGTPRQRFKVLDTMTPLYYARVASLVNELRDKSPAEAEAHFEEMARHFEEGKEYLIRVWEEKGGEK